MPNAQMSNYLVVWILGLIWNNLPARQLPLTLFNNFDFLRLAKEMKY